MKAYCKLTRARPENKELCFTYTHMYESLSKYINCSESLKSDSTHVLFLDFIPTEADLQDAINCKRQGLKVCVTLFDPPRFGDLDLFKSLDAVDEIILFSKVFQNVYPEAYISDYFFNEEVFLKQTSEYENKLCVFGGLGYGRDLPCPIDKVDIGISSYKDLYSRVMNYNGVFVFDTGHDRNWQNIVHYNKAKAVEALMCGRNSYCQEGIKTLRYNSYLKSHLMYNSLEPVSFSQDDIFRLNKQTIEDFICQIQ